MKIFAIIFTSLLIISIVILVIVLILTSNQGQFKMIQSPLDINNYALKTLSNNLKTLTIQNQEMSSCAAILAVNVGSLYDNKVFGLAHFTEHMLFQGTKSYPEYNAFDTIISRSNGQSNAYTSAEDTVYFFESACDRFEEVLDVWSKFYTEPLFTSISIYNETFAVDSEFTNSLNNDIFAFIQTFKLLTNQRNPYSYILTVGNSQTLNKAITLSELSLEVNKFFKTHYFASNMKLMIIGKNTTKELQNLAESKFNKIPDFDYEKYTKERKETPLFTEYPFTKNYTGKIVWFQSIKNGFQLTLIFGNSEIISTQKNKAFDYASYLISSNHNNSLLNILLNKKYAKEIHCTNEMINYKMFSGFLIDITLTNLGLQKIDDVIKLTFGYLRFLKTLNHEKLFEDLKTIKELNFRTLDPKKDDEIFPNKIVNMFLYPPEKLFYSDYECVYDQKIINNFLENLNPENSYVIISTQNQFNSQLKLFDNIEMKKEPWYKRNYKETRINQTQLDEWKNSDITLFQPKPKNNQISSLKSYLNCTTENVENMPSILLNKTNFIATYSCDDTDKTSKVALQINILMNSIYKSKSDYFQVLVLKNYWNSLIISYFSEAKEALNSVEINLNQKGLSIIVHSFSDIIESIVEGLIKLINNAINENSYNTSYDDSLDELDSQKFKTPMEKGKLIMNRLLNPESYYYTEILQIPKTKNFIDFQKNLQNILKNSYLEIIINGNISKLKSKDLIDKLHNSITFYNSDVYNTRIPKTIFEKQVKGSYIYREKNSLETEENHLTMSIYQIKYSTINYSYILLLKLCYANSFPDELRTIKQLGYSVLSGSTVIGSYIYFYVLVQGNNLEPEKTSKQIDDVIQKMTQRLLNSTEEDFNYWKRLAINYNPDYSSSGGNRILRELFNSDFKPNKVKTSKKIETIRLQDLIEFHKNIFYNNPQKISIEIYSGTSQFRPFIGVEKYYLNNTIQSLVGFDLDLIK